MRRTGRNSTAAILTFALIYIALFAVLIAPRGFFLGNALPERSTGVVMFGTR